MPSDSGQRDLSSEDRLLSVTVQGINSPLMLQAFSGREAVSTPYEFRLLMLTDDKEKVSIASFAKKTVTVSMTLEDDKQRPFNGIISSIRHLEVTAEDLYVYEAVMSPALWLLSLYEDCKIFQNKSVPDIVKQVLSSSGMDDKMASSWKTTGTYSPREYCVQYRETTLNFISRLLEEEGIYYYFEHTATTHTIVFADKSISAQPSTYKPNAKFAFAERGAIEAEDKVHTLQQVQNVVTSKATLQDYNFETPSTNLLSKEQGRDPEEQYDYPGKYAALSDGERLAKMRLEEIQTDALYIEGESGCRGFSPGLTFNLSEHPNSSVHGSYFLTSVTHDASDTTFRSKEDERATSYSNYYVALSKKVPYRPPRLSIKPFVRGPQTAVVVGKSGEEIWVDQYGRVKVQFYWDRDGKKDENSSCWVRVSQVWAGKNWGWMTIPRIGQEVIVSFLEGDPDRPIITGRVYNADQMPPWDLPGNQTQSGILTRSSQNGDKDTANWLRFEDKKGSEEISIHAEKDMTTAVENNDTQTVDKDRIITVKGTHTETITKDTTITIKEGNHSLTLNQGNQSITLDQGNQATKLSQGNQSTELSMGDQSTKLSMGNQSTQLSLGNISMKCDLGQISLEAMQQITLTVGANSIKIDQTGVTINGIMISIESDAMTAVKSDALVQIQGAITMIN